MSDGSHKIIIIPILSAPGFRREFNILRKAAIERMAIIAEKEGRDARNIRACVDEVLGPLVSCQNGAFEETCWQEIDNVLSELVAGTLRQQALSTWETRLTCTLGRLHTQDNMTCDLTTPHKDRVHRMKTIIDSTLSVIDSLLDPTTNAEIALAASVSWDIIFWERVADATRYGRMESVALFGDVKRHVAKALSAFGAVPIPSLDSAYSDLGFFV